MVYKKTSHLLVVLVLWEMLVPGYILTLLLSLLHPVKPVNQKTPVHI